MGHDDDTALKALFSAYDPILPDSGEFMRRLAEKGAALEEIREYHLRLRRTARRALIMAAGAGFLTGVVMTLLFPWILRLCAAAGAILKDMTATVPDPSIIMVTAWCVIAGTVILVSLTTYNQLFRPVADHLYGLTGKN